MEEVQNNNILSLQYFFAPLRLCVKNYLSFNAYTAPQ
jgi:hypothetical protein